MKSATAEEVPQQWSQILQWVADGQEVQVTQKDKAVGRLLPAAVNSPDFLAWAKAVWGATPAGAPLSQIVSEAAAGLKQEVKFQFRERCPLWIFSPLNFTSCGGDRTPSARV